MRDTIRGVGPFHSRVRYEADRDLDRALQSAPFPPPWQSAPPIPGEDEEPEKLPALLAFLRQLAHLPSEEREVFFLRIGGTEWQLIPAMMQGLCRRVAKWKSYTPAAIEKKHYKTLKENPALRWAFPDRETKKHRKENDDDEQG